MYMNQDSIFPKYLHWGHITLAKKNPIYPSTIEKVKTL